MTKQEWIEGLSNDAERKSILAIIEIHSHEVPTDVPFLMLRKLTDEGMMPRGVIIIWDMISDIPDGWEVAIDLIASPFITEQTRG